MYVHVCSSEIPFHALLNLQVLWHAFFFRLKLKSCLFLHTVALLLTAVVLMRSLSDRTSVFKHGMAKSV